MIFKTAMYSGTYFLPFQNYRCIKIVMVYRVIGKITCKNDFHPHLWRCFQVFQGRILFFGHINFLQREKRDNWRFLHSRIFTFDKQKTISIAWRLVKSWWLTFTETIKKLKKSSNLIVLSWYKIGKIYNTCYTLSL